MHTIVQTFVISLFFRKKYIFIEKYTELIKSDICDVTKYFYFEWMLYFLNFLFFKESWKIKCITVSTKI